MPRHSLRSLMELKRAKKNISRKVLAEKIGIAPSTLWRWETGKVQPHPAMEKLWRQALEA